MMSNDSNRRVFGTLAFNDAIFVKLEYDRDTMVRFMKRLAYAFIFKYNLAQMGIDVEIFSTITKDSIENRQRVWGLMHVIEHNRKHMSLDDFEQMLIDNNALTDYGEQSDLPERLANDFYQKINAALPNKIALVLQQLTDELYAWASSKNGVVSKAEYDKVTHIPGYLIAPTGRGGNTRGKYAWTNKERSELETHYRPLLIQLKQARNWYKSVCKSESRAVAYDLVRAKFSKKFNISDGMLRRLCYLHTRERNPYRWKPSDIAIEYAARLCSFSGYVYKPFSLSPRQLKEYLPKTASPKISQTDR